MKIAFLLGFKNLMGGKLRTWLNAGTLSITFFMIIFYSGLIEGWSEESRIEAVSWIYGQGHLRYKNYDPYDRIYVNEANGVLPKKQQKNLTPILIQTAVIYPQGRFKSTQLNGIDINQKTLNIPTNLLQSTRYDIPVLIGQKMSEILKLGVGDKIIVRWKDKNGTYDAKKIAIAGIFNTIVPSIDAGQIWMSIDKLRQLTGLENHTTFFVANDKYKHSKLKDWKFVSQDDLLKDIVDLINVKKKSSSLIYFVLLSICLLVIFDTQVLSVFQRKKEIGTYIALGMTRLQVVRIFTIEGVMYSILGIILGLIYGIPIFMYLHKVGINFDYSGKDMGLVMSNIIYPTYKLSLFVSTILVIVVSTTLVSFLPARKIAKMDPVIALKGKIQ